MIDHDGVRDKKNNSNNSKRSTVRGKRVELLQMIWEVMTTVLSGSIRNQIFSFLDEATKKLVLIGKLNKTFFLHFCKKLVSLMIFFQNFADAKLTSNKY